MFLSGQMGDLRFDLPIILSGQAAELLHLFARRLPGCYGTGLVLPLAAGSGPSQESLPNKTALSSSSFLR